MGGHRLEQGVGVGVALLEPQGVGVGVVPLVVGVVLLVVGVVLLVVGVVLLAPQGVGVVHQGGQQGLVVV